MERFVGKEQLVHEGIICFYAKQYWPRVSDTRLKLILVPDAVSENEFLLAKKYLSMKGACSVENRILDTVGMSLPSA